MGDDGEDRKDVAVKTSTCAATEVWPEIYPHGVRLSCCLPAGHDGEHLAADIKYLSAAEAGAS